MPITFLDQVEFSKIPALNFVVPVVASDPAASASDEGRLIYNTTAETLKYCNGATWLELGQAGAGGTPSGEAGGALTGSYPSPELAPDVITDANINSSAGIASSKIAGLDSTLTGKAETTTDFVAGDGLTGGGTLAADRTFAVGSGTGITVNADDVQIDRSATDTWYLQLSGGTLTDFLTLHADPTNALHAASKQYVDLASQGFSFKQAVRAVASSNVSSLSGAGAVVDGVTVASGDRVLLAGQTTASQNGVWVVAAGPWTRSPNMDASGELVDGTLVPVGEGTSNADSQWMCTAIGATPWVPDSSTSTWTKFSSLNDLTAGAGMTRTGTNLDVVSANADMTVGADAITINSAPKWTTGRSITLTGDVTGAVTGVDGSGNISIATTAVGAGTAAKHYASDVGAGTAVVINHALNTRDVVCEVYRNSAPYDTVAATVERTDLNNVTLRFASAVGANVYRVVVTGK